MGTQVEKVVVQGEDRLSRPLRQAESGFNKFSGNLKKLALTGGLAIAGQKIIQFGKDAVMAAVDAQEAASAFETTFGTAADSAGAFVDEWANKMGLARHELKQLLAITGGVLSGIGATDEEAAKLAERMARLAGDVASFTNAAGGTEAVLRALQSGTVGETEALKTYGIAVRQAEIEERALLNTRKENVDELTRLDRAVALVDIAYERSGKAVGDLERTQDSAANQLRELSAMWEELLVQVGEALLPILQEVLPAIKEILPLLADVATQLAEVFAWYIQNVSTTSLSFGEKARNFGFGVAAGAVNVGMSPLNLLFGTSWGFHIGLTGPEKDALSNLGSEMAYWMRFGVAGDGETEPFFDIERITGPQTGRRGGRTGEHLEFITHDLSEMNFELGMMQFHLDRIDPDKISLALYRMGASVEVAFGPLRQRLPATMVEAVDSVVSAIRGGKGAEIKEAIAEMLEIQQAGFDFEANLGTLTEAGLDNIAEMLRTSPNRTDAILAAQQLAADVDAEWAVTLEESLDRSSNQALKDAVPEYLDPLAGAKWHALGWEMGTLTRQGWDEAFGTPWGDPPPHVTPTSPAPPGPGHGYGANPDARGDTIVVVQSVSVQTAFPSDEPTRRRAAHDIISAVADYGPEVNRWQHSR